MPAAGTARASALIFARFVTPDTVATDEGRAIKAKSLFAFMTPGAVTTDEGRAIRAKSLFAFTTPIPLAAELRLAFDAAAEADVLTAELRAPVGDVTACAAGATRAKEPR